MINSYTRFTATLLVLNVVTILIAGLFILRHFPPIHTINAILAGGFAIVLLCVRWKWVPVFAIIYGLIFSVLTIPSLVISMFRSVDPEYNAMLEASNPFIGISFLTAIFVLAILTFSILSLKANIQQTNEPFSFFPLVKGALFPIPIQLPIVITLQNFPRSHKSSKKIIIS